MKFIEVLLKTLTEENKMFLYIFMLRIWISEKAEQE